MQKTINFWKKRLSSKVVKEKLSSNQGVGVKGGIDNYLK